MATAVFTSAHGVEAVAECLFHLPTWKIACINGKTKKTAEHYFDEKDIIASAPNAAALIKELDGKIQEPVLFFCGNLRLDTIPNWLKDTGTQFEEIQVYKTEFTPHDIQNKKPAAVLFFSTSAVESFFSINTLPAETVCFAIGKTTAAALSQKLSNRIIVSAQPDKAALVELVINYYHEHS
jgi:uroporphyrinogen-III synthase